MEVAFLLLIFVFVECALTVWLLARHRDYLKRVQRLENKIIKDNKVNNENKEESVSDLISSATPEEIEQVQQVLAALGLGGDGGTR